MASGVLPKPGYEYGPCIKECKHIDCAEQRRVAWSPCRICKKKIDYDIHYYRDDKVAGAFVHAVCLEEEVEAEMGARS